MHEKHLARCLEQSNCSINVCSGKKKRQRLTSRAPFLLQSPQSIKAALLSKSLGPKGNQTQQLQLCPPGLLPLGPRCLCPWPRKECCSGDLAVNFPPASSTHKSISSAQQQAPPRPAHPAHGEPTVIRAELHTCLVLLPFTVTGAAGGKNERQICS